MAQPRFYEDYTLGDVRETMGRTITETDFVVHAGHTGDFFPHHMDAEFMKTQPFGQRIAHGTMTFAIGIGLTAAEVNPLAFTYGYDRLRFPRPVFIGDTVRTVLTIASMEPDPKRPQHGAWSNPAASSTSAARPCSPASMSCSWKSGPRPKQRMTPHEMGARGRDRAGPLPRRDRQGHRSRSTEIPGRSMLDKMRHINEVDGAFRRFVTFEPRASAHMSLNLLLPSDHPEADAGFIVLQSDRAHAMSGSNCICVVTALLETGRVRMTEPETVVTLETPAGLVRAVARCARGRCLSVSLDNVPAFVEALDSVIATPALGTDPCGHRLRRRLLRDRHRGPDRADDYAGPRPRSGRDRHRTAGPDRRSGSGSSS